MADLEGEIRRAFERRLAAVPARPDLRARVSDAVASQSSPARSWGVLAVTAALLLAGGVTFYVLVAHHAQPAPVIGPTPIVKSPMPSPTACLAATPAPRASAGLAYDSLRHAIVMFGGSVGDLPESNETWTFSDGCWRLQRPAISPPGRSYAVLAYDPVRKVTVLYGGYQHRPNQPTTIMSDTWLWNGESWSQVAVGTGPDLFTFQGAFDQARRVLVVFGNTGETWIWDGRQWTRQSPAVSPQGRGQAVMGYDPITREVLLYGGFSDGYPGELGDTWLWDGTNWTQQHPAASPGPRQDAAMASGQALVLYGGDGVGIQSDTWLWTGSTWRQVTPAQNPGRRAGAAAAGNGKHVWLFGGSVYPAAAAGAPAADLWQWDGLNWSQVQPQ